MLNPSFSAGAGLDLRACLPALSPPNSWGKAALDRVRSRFEKLDTLWVDFDLLAATVAGISEQEPTGKLWDGPCDSGRLCSLLICSSHVPDEVFEGVIQYAKQRANYDRRTLAMALADGFRSEKIMRGISAAEIGGTFLKKAMSALGAEVVCADAGYMPAERDGRNTFVVDPDLLVTPDNFQKFFPGRYDLVVTSCLMCKGSGIEEIAGDPVSEHAAREGGIQLLTVFSNIMKPGALGFHRWFSLNLNDQLPRLGCEFGCFYGHGPYREQDGIAVLIRMTAEQIAAGSPGLSVGGRQVVFNPERDQFEIS